MDALNLSLPDFLDHVAGPSRAPGAIPAAATTAALGVALFEKALLNPPEGVKPGQGSEILSVLSSLRKRILDLANADVHLMAGLETAIDQAKGDEAANRVAAYRSARRLVDFTIQGLAQVPPTLDFGSTAMLADIETGWRLLAAAMESAIACCEDHLKHLDIGFADSEAQALRRTGQQGREMVGRAQGALSWRRGKA